MEPKWSDSEQVRLIREWVEAYRLWNEQELARRRASAGREPVEEKLAAFFDLCETMWQIAPPKSAALYQAQLRAHAVERERMRRFEERRAHGNSTAKTQSSQRKPQITQRFTENTSTRICGDL